MRKVDVIGFYKENPAMDEETDFKPSDLDLTIIVFKNENIRGEEWLEGYNVKTGHFEIKDKEYLTSCKKISKKTYLDATADWFTPVEYLL